MQADILIRNALLYDGTLSGPVEADVAVTADMISAVGRSLSVKASTVIDAAGSALAPGFIDTHAHSDFTILADPRAEGKILQGITTEINGNCGMSAAPLIGKAYERRKDDLDALGIRERWTNFTEYFSMLEQRGTAVNIATLAGHGNIRGSVVGYDNTVPDEDRMNSMKSLLNNALSDGAIGMSTGLIYPPGVFSRTEELISLAEVLSGHDGIYTSHMRSEGDHLCESVREVISIGTGAGVKVHVSHIKTAGERNWHKAEEIISLIENTIKNRVRISCDRYPYTASSTDLDAILPSWTFEGGNENELRRLKDPVERKKIELEMRGSMTADYWTKVIVSTVAKEENKWMEGRTIEDIACSQHRGGFDTFVDILIDERLRSGAIFLSMSETNMKRFLSLPYCMIGSDSSARSFDGLTRTGKPHPRGFGTFPRLLGRYVRDEGLMDLTTAIHKSTLLAAQTFGLSGRGRIAEDMYADLVLFDPATIKDAATFEDPFQRPVGISHVFVNGKAAVNDGRTTGGLFGKVLKRIKR